MRKQSGEKNIEEVGESVQWMQAKMMGEIAYQLAVMNERRLDNPTAVEALKQVEWCGAVSPDRKFLCGLDKGHAGNCGWSEGSAGGAFER